MTRSWLNRTEIGLSSWDSLLPFCHIFRLPGASLGHGIGVEVSARRISLFEKILMCLYEGKVVTVLFWGIF